MDTKALLEQLRSADENARAEAREELTMHMDEEMARAFLDIAKSDAPERVRADTIIGLGPIIDDAGLYFFDIDEGETPDPDMEPEISRETFDAILGELRAIYEDESQPKLVRRSAIEALVRHPQPWHLDVVGDLAESNDPDWRITSVFAMGYVPGFDDEIVKVLATADGAMLYEAVRAAGRAEVTESAAKIREIATSEQLDSGLRAAAIEALPYVDDDCDELLEQLADSEDEEIAEAAEAALEEISLFAQQEEEEVEE
jgi:hypothetical protein